MSAQHPGPERQVIGLHTREWLVWAENCSVLHGRRMLYLGVSEAQEGFAFCRLAPAFDFVAACVEGAGRAWTEQGWLDMREGHILVAPAGVPHSYCAGTGTWKLAWVVYEAGALGLPKEMAAPQMRSADGTLLAANIRGLHAELLQGFHPGSAQHHYIELIHTYVTRALGESPLDQRLQRLWAQVDSRLSEAWSLPMLAKTCGLSREQLRRLSTQQWRRSPMEQVTHLRMARAALLLERTNEKVATVGAEVGYRDPFAFSVAFKKWSGLAPADFRGRLRKG